MDDKSKNYFAELAGGHKNITPPADEESAVDEEISLSGTPTSGVGGTPTSGVGVAADSIAAAPAEPVLVKPAKAERLAIKTAKPSRGARAKVKEEDKEEDNIPITEHDDSFIDDSLGEAEGQLTVDVFQTPDDIIIQSTIAGVRPEDLTVDITSESVSIRGRRERSKSVSDDDYFYQECYWGRFSRSIILPQEINQDKAEASLRDGVLTIRLPKLERAKNKKLRLKIT